MEEEKFSGCVQKQGCMNDEQLDQFSKSCLVLQNVCTTFSMAVLTRMNTAFNGGRKRERGCVDRAKFFSTVASISS